METQTLKHRRSENNIEMDLQDVKMWNKFSLFKVKGSCERNDGISRSIGDKTVPVRRTTPYLWTLNFTVSAMSSV